MCQKYCRQPALCILVEMNSERYAAASKTERSHYVLEMIHIIRSAGGAFVRLEQGGQWFEVGDKMAREKVSATFRNVLHTLYKSSTPSKVLRRRKKKMQKKPAARTAEDGAWSDSSSTPEDLQVSDWSVSVNSSSGKDDEESDDDENSILSATDAIGLSKDDLEFDPDRIFSADHPTTATETY